MNDAIQTHPAEPGEVQTAVSEFVDGATNDAVAAELVAVPVPTPTAVIRLNGDDDMYAVEFTVQPRYENNNSPDVLNVPVGLLIAVEVAYLNAAGLVSNGELEKEPTNSLTINTLPDPILPPLNDAVIVNPVVLAVRYWYAPNIVGLLLVEVIANSIQVPPALSEKLIWVEVRTVLVLRTAISRLPDATEMALPVVKLVFIPLELAVAVSDTSPKAILHLHQ